MIDEKFGLVIFDLDGTLIDAFKPVADSLNYSLEQLGYTSVSEEEVRRNVGRGETTLLRSFVKEEDIPKILTIYRPHHQETLKTGTQFLLGAQELLLHLKSDGYQLALATNRSKPFTDIILEQLNIRSLFSYVICGDEIAHPKPAGDMLEIILEKLGFQKEEAIFIGDMSVDIICGKNAGVRTIAFVSNPELEDILRKENPWRMVYSCEEILNMLKITAR